MFRILHRKSGSINKPVAGLTALFSIALFMAFSPASTSAGSCPFNAPTGLPACSDGCYIPTPGPSGGGPLDYWNCVPNAQIPPGGALSFSPASVKNGAGFTISLSGGPANVAPTHLLINTSDNDESHYGANFKDFGPFDSARTNASGSFSFSRTMNCAAYTSYTPGQSVNLTVGGGKKIYQQVKLQWPDGSFSSVAKHVKDCTSATSIVAPSASSTVAGSCALSGSVKEFDAFPPQPYPGYFSALYTAYYAGSGGGFKPYQLPNSGPRLLHSTPFGYTVIDITNRDNPQSLIYEDYRIAQGYPLGGPIACPGDCHSSVNDAAVSADGQRVMFSLAGGGMSVPYGFGSLVGQPSSGTYGFRLMGGNNAGGEPLLQKVGDKYFAYLFNSSYRVGGVGSVSVADVTTLPRDGLAAETAEDGKGGALNPIPYSSASSLPGGYGATLSGYWITYTDGKDGYLVNASNPLPASALTAQRLTAADFGHSSDNLMSLKTAQDPAYPAAVYLLGQFTTTTPAHYTPDMKSYVQATITPTGYTLVRVLGGVPTIVGSFRPNAGETGVGGNLAADSAGNLFAFMGVRMSTGDYRQYSSSVKTFGTTPGFFETSNVFPGAFVAGAEPGQIYGYSAGAISGSVFPMTCGTSTTPVSPTPTPTPTPTPGGSAGSCDFTLTANPATLIKTVPSGQSSYVSFGLSSTKPADPTCPAITLSLTTLRDDSGNTVATPLSSTLTISPGNSTVAIYNVSKFPGSYAIPIKAYGRGVQKTVKVQLNVQ